MGNIYKPPKENNNNSNIESFISELSPKLHNLARSKANIMIAGDFNINLLQLKSRPAFSNFFDLMLTNSFWPTITFPTRFTENTCTLIDNLYYKSNSNNALISSGILVTDISDHLPCFSTFDVSPYYKKDHKTTIFKRLCDENNLIKLHNEILSSNIYNLLDKSTTHNPNINYNILENVIISSMDKIMPLKRFKFNKYRHKKQPWITNGLLKSIRYKDKLYRNLKQTKPTASEFLVIKNNLRVYKCILGKCIRHAKRTYFNTQLYKYKTDTSQTWKILNQIIGNKKEHTLGTEINIDGNMVDDPHNIAEEFNKYFSEIGTKLADNLKDKSDITHKSFLKDTINSQFRFKQVNEQEVNDIFKELHSKNSAGHDTISTRTLKAIQPAIIKPITLIINQSLNTGVFPSKLKIAKVIPVYKKGNKLSLENYRPISLLPSISKIFEKVVFNQLYSYFDSNNLLNSKQYGFRKLFSTEHALLHFTDRIISEMDKSNYPLAIFLDLSKAFDTLNPEILIDKLKYYGVVEDSLAWFHSYLTNRKQYVQYENNKSSISNINLGVPQGSILGPLLFIIYTNDLVHASDFFEPILYADDTSLISKSIDFNKQLDIEKLNTELNNIFSWLSINKLSLNVTKTKYMIFTPKNKILNLPHITINNEPIQNVSDFSFLGILLNEHMSWQSHIDNISNKISRKIGLIHKLKHFLPISATKTLYSSLILPLLNYGILAWGTSTTRLFKLQKKAVRAITNSNYNAHTEPLFKLLNILKIDDLYRLNLLKFYYKYVNNELPLFFNSFSIMPRSEMHTYDTRQKENMCTNPSIHCFADKCVRSQLPIALNNTPLRILQKIYTHSYKGFTNYVKHFIIENYQMECLVQNCYVCKS